KLNELDADEQADICESLHDHADELYRSTSPSGHVSGF
ncbi:Rop family plasmid primer RNA-binding protein, partial [Shigella sonnei]